MMNDLSKIFIEKSSFSVIDFLYKSNMEREKRLRLLQGLRVFDSRRCGYSPDDVDVLMIYQIQYSPVLELNIRTDGVYSNSSLEETDQIRIEVFSRFRHDDFHLHQYLHEHYF